MDVYSNQIPTPGFIDRSYDIDDLNDKLEQMSSSSVPAWSGRR